MDERLQFVARRLADEGMAELCREFGISRKTGHPKRVMKLTELANLAVFMASDRRAG